MAADAVAVAAGAAAAAADAAVAAGAAAVAADAAVAAVPRRLQMRRKNQHHRKGPVGHRLRQPARFEGRFEHFSPTGAFSAAFQSKGRYDMTVPGSRVACSAHHIPYNSLAIEENPLCGAHCVAPWSGSSVAMAPTCHRLRLARQIGRNRRPRRAHELIWKPGIHAAANRKRGPLSAPTVKNDGEVGSDEVAPVTRTVRVVLVFPLSRFHLDIAQLKPLSLKETQTLANAEPAALVGF